MAGAQRAWDVRKYVRRKCWTRAAPSQSNKNLAQKFSLIVTRHHQSGVMDSRGAIHRSGLDSF